MSETITLQIEGSAIRSENVAGWEAQVFRLNGVDRGTDQAACEIDVPDGAVVELLLANGLRILTTADEIHRYLGSPLGRGEGPLEEAKGKQTKTIAVGQALRLSGPRLPEGLSREGIGAWVLKGLRVFTTGPAGMTALIAAGSFQDARLEHRLGLYRCSTDSWGLTEVKAMPASGEPCLLLLHGTASSSEGSFGGLWEQARYRQTLSDTYGKRIYAFEHRTLTESPVANVLDLIKQLPEGVRLHLVSHSRGGIVGELLARANRLDRDPITQGEIDRFKDMAKRSGHKGLDADVDRLQELNREMLTRRIRVERFVRVACPARGTTLVSGRLDRWASVMANLFGKGLQATGKAIPMLDPVTKGLELLQNFLLAVVRERTDARILPGLEAMMPDSALVGLLNGDDVRIESPLHVLAGDFQGDGLLPWLGDCLSEVFYGGLTDLVVNTPSMSGGAARHQGIWQKSLSGPEVHHLSYFRRDESVKALLDGLQGKNDDFEQLDGPSQAVISRGGIEIKPLDNAPIVLMLPGIMGSHLQAGRNRIWFDPIDLCAGHMEDLQIKAAHISPDGWMDRNYEKLARYLAQTHEVRPFAFDWRQSIEQTAQNFWDTTLKGAMEDASKRGKPLRILAHSMGGLVARLALANHWDEFKNIPGSRLLQLGTPNNGSHSIAAVLLGRDDFVQSIERWFDWKHDMHDFLAIVVQFPGVLEMLPWPVKDGLAGDGVDYFDPATWTSLYKQDHPKGTKPRWVQPTKEALAAAQKTIATLGKASLAPECCLYVAGRAPTPMAIRSQQGKVEIGWSEEGDGRVPWSTGIPAGVPVWYTDAVHGDLANHEKAFAAYRELLETGSTRLLSRSPVGTRGEAAPIFRERGLQGGGLYPNAEEILAAATGGVRPSRRRRSKGEAPVEIEVFYGSVAAADAPVLVGAYTGDALRGSTKFLNHHLQGRLERARAIGRYPCRVGNAMVFRQTESNTKPAGAIVVGLGPLGDLLPGTLTQALTQGLLEYARIMEQQSQADPDSPERLAVASLLVGGGFAGLAIDSSARCLLEALRRANRLLQQYSMKTRIGSLTLFEEVQGRAITLVQALRDLVGEPRFAEVARFDGRLRDGQGGFCGRSLVTGGGQGMYRVHIVADQGRLRFTVVTDRARNEVSAEPDQRQAVDGLIRSATHTTMDQPGLSRALFELLVPNSMKEAVADLRTLMLSVDVEAASYPWELIRDTDQVGEPPLAARIELVRQLATPHGRGRVAVVTEPRAFIVGDTQSGMAELPGAQAEAQMVENFFIQAEYKVESLQKASAQEVFDGLFNGHYRFVHLAGHGVVKDKNTGCTGMVLGPETFLTAAQVTKLRRVPEFVFINCCHLGSMATEQQQWGELAANLATEFIQMGCEAVIAAGWAVDDLAASTFARTFYEAMFKGVRFGQALLQARAETHRNHPQTNTWGAFQAYGDEQYRFPNAHDRDEDEVPEYVHPSHLIADLDRHCARLLDATEEERKNYYASHLKAIEKAARGTDFQHAGVREKLAVAWTEMGDRERAIGHYRAALSFEDAGLSLHALEQLANLEIRYGSDLLQYKGKDAKKTQEKHDQGILMMEAGRLRLEQLLTIGKTTQRYSLMGFYWKRLAQAQIAQDNLADVKTWLKEMDEAYWQAADHGYKRTGSWDYHSLLNALDAIFLRALWGEAEHLERITPQLTDLLHGASEHGQRQYADHHLFFHALAEVEALRIDSLWAFLDKSRPLARLSNSEVANHLVGLYRHALGRLGNISDQDSTINQLHFLIKLMPKEGEQIPEIKRALEGLITGISSKEQ